MEPLVGEICLIRKQINTNSPKRINDPIWILGLITVKSSVKLAQEGRESILEDSFSGRGH